MFMPYQGGFAGAQRFQPLLVPKPLMQELHFLLSAHVEL